MKHDRNPTATAAAFAQEFSNDVPPSRQSMHALAEKFHETASLTDKKRSGRPKNVNTDENKMLGLSIRMHHQHLQFVLSSSV